MISSQQARYIKKIIAEIENPILPDDAISNYKDFLACRDFLHFCQFNKNVFNSLLDITISNWHTEKRVNRLSLIAAIKDYLKYQKAKNYYERFFLIDNRDKLDEQHREKIFTIFKLIIEEGSYLPNSQREASIVIANMMIYGISLPTDAEHWFCANWESKPFLINRILRYPSKSTIISAWVKENYTNPLLVTRRAELVSWIIDEDPSFEVSNDTLLADFTILNEADKKAIIEYLQELDAFDIINKELTNELPLIDMFSEDGNILNPSPNDYYQVRISPPEFRLSRRFYRVPITNERIGTTNLPNFELLTNQFLDNIAFTKQITMAWAIGYSRLTPTEKAELLIKYTNPATVTHIIKVCKKLKIVPMLERLIK